MKLKGKKTTLVAYIGLVISVGIFIAFLFGKLDATELTASIGVVGTFVATFVGFFSEDQKKIEKQGDDITPPPGPPPKGNDPDD